MTIHSMRMARGGGGPVGRSQEEAGCLGSLAEKRLRMKIKEALPGAVESAELIIRLHCLRHVCEGSRVFLDAGEGWGEISRSWPGQLQG